MNSLQYAVMKYYYNNLCHQSVILKIGLTHTSNPQELTYKTTGGNESVVPMWSCSVA